MRKSRIIIYILIFIYVILSLPVSASETSAKSYEYDPLTNKVYAVFENVKEQVENAELIFVDADVIEDSGDGSYSSPFQTIERALIESEKTSKDCFIIVKPSVIQVTDTIKITQSQGKKGRKLVLMSYGDKAELSGAITQKFAWTLYDEENDIYVTDFKKNMSFRQIYVNGIRATRAKGTQGISSLVANYETYPDGYTTQDTTLLGFSKPHEIEFVYYIKWTNPRCCIESVIKENDNIKVKMNSEMWTLLNSHMRGSTTIFPELGDTPIPYSPLPAWYENAYELIDEQGEWYYDKDIGKLYYKPRECENLSEADITIPLLDTIISINGSVNVPIHNVELHNIKLTGTDWEAPTIMGGLADYQGNYIYVSGAWNKQPAAALEVYSGRGVVIENCEFMHLGSSAIRFSGASKNSRIGANVIGDVSGTGISVGEIRNYEYYFESPKNLKYGVSNIRIHDNYIYDIGRDYQAAVGIETGYVDELVVENNEIFNVPYSGIHIGWGWTTKDSTNIHKNIIRNNYVNDFLNTMYDGAGIYTAGTTGGSPTDMNKIYGNYVKDDYAYDLQPMVRAMQIDSTVEKSYWHIYNNVLDVYCSDESIRKPDVKWLVAAPYYFIKTENNYTTCKYEPAYRFTADKNEDLFNCEHEAAVLCTDGWPLEAQGIINNAGITNYYRKAIGNPIQQIDVEESISVNIGETFTIPFKGYTLKEEPLVTELDCEIIYCVADGDIVSKTSGGFYAMKKGTTEVSVYVVHSGILTKKIVTVTVI